MIYESKNAYPSLELMDGAVDIGYITNIRWATLAHQ